MTATENHFSQSHVVSDIGETLDIESTAPRRRGRIGLLLGIVSGGLAIFFGVAVAILLVFVLPHLEQTRKIENVEELIASIATSSNEQQRRTTAFAAQEAFYELDDEVQMMVTNSDVLFGEINEIAIVMHVENWIDDVIARENEVMDQRNHLADWKDWGWNPTERDFIASKIRAAEALNSLDEMQRQRVANYDLLQQVAKRDMETRTQLAIELRERLETIQWTVAFDEIQGSAVVVNLYGPYPASQMGLDSKFENGKQYYYRERELFMQKEGIIWAERYAALLRAKSVTLNYYGSDGVLWGSATSISLGWPLEDELPLLPSSEQQGI